MGCCFSSQASNAASHREHEPHGRIATPPPQIPPEQYDPRHIGVLPDPIITTPPPPIAAPVAISGATEQNMPAIVEAMTPNEVVEGASSSASASSSSSLSPTSQHVILEPTVYVPPSRRQENGVAEAEGVPGLVEEEEEEEEEEEAVEPPEERTKASSSSSSGSSSSSTSKSSREE
ncbi:hypothetical protein BBK36DRAFT_1169731 [Trichoderma citrinoviride]|uniref:Uncharacterized protein n=1 Tax=Trichoderma citrinoviride TaxID=58853 RepID=A0A2T4BA17_9HYPO|nr:hypothetical protein BBK36DRAFT_1169731 [Trichoderma citrinoviride]PTB66059.1 hypothetical protein BBK36DRAFT_1169731 [Trichoderma citrinoviride]